MVLSRRLIASCTIVVVACVGAVAVGLRSTPPLPVNWRAALTTETWHAHDGRLVQSLGDGGRIELTLAPGLQHSAEQLLAGADPIKGAVVVVSVDDGRVLALAGRDAANPGANTTELATTAWAPAASVFKLATTAALLDAGLTPEARVCYHEGTRSVEHDNLVDHPELDSRCKSLGYGLARSQNAIIGRLAHDYLDPTSLIRSARRLGFGQRIAFDLPVQPSPFAMPTDSLGFARTAAGFWNADLSAVHGALMAVTIARGGDMPELRIVDRVVDGQARTVWLPPPVPATHAALPPSTAHALARMMVGTTEWGSAARAFRDPASKRARLPVRVAGKTGTLTGRHPLIAYSWFIGFAPADRPEVAFAVLLGRHDSADVRAAEVARSLLSAWLTRDAGDRPVAYNLRGHK
jgi:penicillin-binding protein A